MVREREAERKELMMEKSSVGSSFDDFEEHRAEA
jgi:hypothetical protein